MQKATKSYPIFLSDQPIYSSKEDQFNYGLFVDQLETIIANCETPANIGLFGRWGVGKTSILNLLKERIDEKQGLRERFDYVCIDAWKFSKESLRQQLLLELNNHYKAFKEEEIEDILFNIREVPLEIHEKLREKASRYISLFSLFFLGTMIIIVAYFVLTMCFKVEFALSTMIELLMIPLLLQLSEKVITAASEVKKSATKIVPKIEYAHQFENLFKNMIKKRGDKTLLLAVDNLDRCESELVVDFLGTIKTFLEIPGCIYLLACDDEALERHLVNVKGERFAEPDAKEFLRKFFHSMLRIPTLIDEDLEKYMDRMLSKVDIKFGESVKEVLLQAMTKNPRRVKQFLNNLAVIYRLAEAKEQVGLIRKEVVTGNTGFLAKITIIRDEWADFYRRLEQREDLLDYVERYFEGEEIPDIEAARIQEYFDQNQGIEWFLRATRAVTSYDVAPFIRLHQESYESSIPELEVLRLRVRQNDVDYVRRIVEKTSDEQERTRYILEILKFLNSDLRLHRFQSAFNATNVLLETLDLATDQMRDEVIASLQNSLTTKEIKANLGKFDRSKIFNVAERMTSLYRNRIFMRYIELLIRETSYDASLLDLLIQRRKIFPSDVINALNESLAKFLTVNETEALKIIYQKLCSDPNAANDVVTDKLVATVVERIGTEISDVNNNRCQVYVALKHLASQQTKARFVSTLLTIVRQRKESSITREIRFAIGQLNSLTSEDIPRNVFEELYETLAECSLRMTDEMQKIEVLAPVFMIFGSMKEETKKNLIENHLVPLMSRCTLQCINRVLDVARQHSVHLTNYEPFFNALINRVKSSLPDGNLIQFLIEEAQEKQKVSIGQSLAQMIQSNNPTLLSPAFQALQKNYEKLVGEALDAVCNACLDMAKRFPPQRKTFLEPMITEAITRCSSTPKNSVADLLLEYIKSDDVSLSSLGTQYYLRIQSRIAVERRRNVLRQVIIRLRNLLDRIDTSWQHLIDIIIQGQQILEEDDISDFLDVMIAQLSTAKQESIQLVGLVNITKVTKLYNRADDVISHVLELAKSTSSEKVKSAAREVMQKHSGEVSEKLRSDLNQFLLQP